MYPRHRPCLSAAFTFEGRSSPEPSILMHYKDRYNLRNHQTKSTFRRYLSTNRKSWQKDNARGFAVLGIRLLITYNDNRIKLLCHIVSLFNLLFVDGLTTLHEGHSSHQSAHGGLVFIGNRLSGCQSCTMANGVNVPERVVFGWWCPSGHNRWYRVLVVSSNISTEY